MTVHRPFDPGLQLERTELAWRRTALAIAIGALIGMRVLTAALPSALDPWAIGAGLAGLVIAAWLWVGARRRRVRLHAVLTGGRAIRPDGGQLAVLAVVVTGLGMAAGVLALLRALA